MKNAINFLVAIAFGAQIKDSLGRGRGGLMSRRDAWSQKALLESGKIRSIDCNGIEIQRSALSCSMLDYMSQTEARVTQLLQGDSPAGRHKAEACLLKARLKVCETLMNFGHMRLPAVVDLFHCTYVKLMDDVGLAEDMRSDPAPRLRMQLLVSLPIMKLPFRFTGVSGPTAYVIIPNIPSMRDQDLPLHTASVFELLRSLDRAAASGPAVMPQDVQLLKDAMPSFVSPLVDWLIVKAGFDPVVNKSLGINYARGKRVGERFALLCQVELPKLKHEAEALALQTLAEKAKTDVKAVQAAMQTATTRHMRSLVAKRGIFSSSNHATKEMQLQRKAG